jgi:diamine N-acetyltransferase
MSEPPIITLRPVDADNWRAVAALAVSERQQAWVAQPSYYLALCAYSPAGWRPLAALDADGAVVGFLMWTVDPQDGAAWLGGIIVDQAKQGSGYGRAAVSAAMELIRAEAGVISFALSYEPENTAAARLYASLGFVETGETEESELVARLRTG